jgi:FKBP-type peptidyl-prolyl cis-trans isomerase FklB
MKKTLIVLSVLCSIYTTNAQTKGKAPLKPTGAKLAATKPLLMKNLSDSFSYAVGYAVASNMKSQNVRRLNTTIMQRAIDDVYKNTPPLINPAVLNGVLQRQSQLFAEEKQKEDKANETVERAKAATEIAKGEAFLAENKKRKEVITLPSGLQYEVIKKSDSAGAKPKLNDVVTVNYIGSLIDGKEFENSYKSQPASFQVSGVIPGWTEALQLMTVGDKWKVYVPTELAYYLYPRDPSVIPPGAALIFEISLEGIKK